MEEKKKKVEEGLLTKTATKIKDFSLIDLFVEWLVDTQVVGSMSKEAAFINYKNLIFTINTSLLSIFYNLSYIINTIVGSSVNFQNIHTCTGINGATCFTAITGISVV